ncbi:phosphotransferase [Marinomonas aquiplantarum]|uniref:Ecdysteroid kinase n=1 Tax=Marinomonas aquiplantarum TaxID=491951 RepID=A0A366CV67_9GAMM|nr:phosphotransferase [Marinomonas aquiplantarum]RBO78457.1 ecdysteroid kinase [Marinomonas aquiplantarum]
MSPEIFVKRSLSAESVVRVEVIQSLWSGYGEIVRYRVSGAQDNLTSVIVKSIRLDEVMAHPRGWQSDLSHQRKQRSYQVEAIWYSHWSPQLLEAARVAKCYAVQESETEILLLLEDLDASGFGHRHRQLTWSSCLPVLDWLACFHSAFVNTQMTHSEEMDDDKGLWERGSYWHLATRPDEWQAMAEGELKRQASVIDQMLRKANFQTLIHGDAKVANFCFSESGADVAAVDFQYTGQGIGVQDVAYFLGSCLDEASLAEHLPFLLEHYFAELARCLVAQGESPDFASKVEAEWRSLFDFAWADFHRFILGWSPNHAKNTPFSQMITERALALLRTS